MDLHMDTYDSQTVLGIDLCCLAVLLQPHHITFMQWCEYQLATAQTVRNATLTLELVQLETSQTAAFPLLPNLLFHRGVLICHSFV